MSPAMPPDSGNCEELVSRASHGDVSALDVLMARFTPGLRRYIGQEAGNAVLAKESRSDILQSVCREVLEQVRDGRFEYRGEGEFKQWFFQAAYHKLQDRRKYYAALKRDIAQEIPLPPSSVVNGQDQPGRAVDRRSPSEAAIYQEEMSCMDWALRHLSPQQSKIVRWAKLEGLSHREIAERLEITEVNSRRLLSRSLARLATLQRNRLKQIRSSG